MIPAVVTPEPNHDLLHYARFNDISWRIWHASALACRKKSEHKRPTSATYKHQNLMFQKISLLKKVKKLMVVIYFHFSELYLIPYFI